MAAARERMPERWRRQAAAGIVSRVRHAQFRAGNGRPQPTDAARAVRRLVLALLGVALAAVPAAAAAPPQPDPADSSAEILALERALADALHARDRDRLEALLAPGYVLRGAPDIARAQWIDNAVTLCWGDRSDIDAFAASRHDQMVVAAFTLTFYVDPGSCQPALLRSLITDVWIRDGDQWRLLVRHAAPPSTATGVAAQYGAVPLAPATWEASGELSLVATGGNTDTRTLGLGGEVTHRAGRSESRGAVAFLTSEADEITRARSLHVEARHGYRVRERLELFGRGAYARDRFAGIDGRAAVAGGAAYTAGLPPKQVLTAEGSLGFVLERRRDATRLEFASATGALRYAWTIVPGTELAEEASVLADLESAGNWRGASTTALTVVLSRVLSLKVSHALEYRHRPVAGFGRTDMRTAAALVFSVAHRPAPP